MISLAALARGGAATDPEATAPQPARMTPRPAVSQTASQSDDTMMAEGRQRLAQAPATLRQIMARMEELDQVIQQRGPDPETTHELAAASNRYWILSGFLDQARRRGLLRYDSPPA